jgi:hypothetical protein
MNFWKLLLGGGGVSLHELQSGTQYHISQKGKHSEMRRKERDRTACVNRRNVLLHPLSCHRTFQNSGYKFEELIFALCL